MPREYKIISCGTYVGSQTMTERLNEELQRQTDADADWELEGSEFDSRNGVLYFVFSRYVEKNNV